MVRATKKTTRMRVHDDFFKITQDIKNEYGFKYNSEATKLLATYFKCTFQKRKKKHKRKSSHKVINKKRFMI